MWRHCCKLLPNATEQKLLLCDNTMQQQVRTTFILKRKMPPQLHKKDGPPKRLKSKHYIYDLVQDTNTVRQPDLEVILTEYVEGIGNIGERVSVRPNFAYNHLLLPGVAVYASPENIEKYQDNESSDQQYSSPTMQRTLNILANKTLSVVMNKDMPWILKPWHIKASFRKCGYHVPEEAITMPSKPIEGPNMDIENKEFIITVTVNKTEKTEVRCRIHHWATSITERLPYVPEFWKKSAGKIFEENKNQIETI